jgi:hypothetical protein
MRKSTCGDPAWTTSRSYSNPAFSITLRTHPPGTSQRHGIRASHPIEEPEKTARGREQQRRPRAWSYLVSERLANVKEVGIFYAVRRHKGIDRGTQLGGYAVEGVSRLHYVGPALTVG